jgi:hypothetical protein
MERPSHPPPENRKAAELRKAERDPIRVARRAVIGVHKAQRQLQLASDRGERQQLMAALSNEAAARRKAVFAAVHARYAAQRLLISPALSAQARAAELARLAAEEQAELQQAEQRELLADWRFRRERLAALAAGQKLRRRLMALRQRHERAMFAVLLHGFRPQPPPPRGDDRGPGPAPTTQRQGRQGRKPNTPRRR